MWTKLWWSENGLKKKHNGPWRKFGVMGSNINGKRQARAREGSGSEIGLVWGGQRNAQGLTKSADVKHANEGETKGLAQRRRGISALWRMRVYECFVAQIFLSLECSNGVQWIKKVLRGHLKWFLPGWCCRDLVNNCLRPEMQWSESAKLKIGWSRNFVWADSRKLTWLS